MPIDFTNLTSERGADNQTVYTTRPVALPADRLALMSVVNVAAGTPNQPTITGWVPILTHLISPQRITLFRRKPASELTGTHTIDVAAQSQFYCVWSIEHGNADVDSSGTEGSGAIVQSASGGANPGASPLVLTLAAFASANNATFGAFGLGYEAKALAAGLGFQELSSPGEGAFSDRAMLVEYKSTHDTSVDMEHGSLGTIDIWNGIALEIKALPSQYVGGQNFRALTERPDLLGATGLRRADLLNPRAWF